MVDSIFKWVSLGAVQEWDEFSKLTEGATLTADEVADFEARCDRWAASGWLFAEDYNNWGYWYARRGKWDLATKKFRAGQARDVKYSASTEEQQANTREALQENLEKLQAPLKGPVRRAPRVVSTTEQRGEGDTTNSRKAQDHEQGRVG